MGEGQEGDVYYIYELSSIRATAWLNSSSEKLRRERGRRRLGAGGVPSPMLQMKIINFKGETKEKKKIMHFKV
jgi:hypothetical protein